ncbi:unnamed protein product [Alternaria alternata]
MQRRSLVERSPNSSFKPGTSLMERDYSGPTGDDVDLDTDLSYADAFADEDDEDGAYLSPDNDYPPEYYIQQLETFNEEDVREKKEEDAEGRSLQALWGRIGRFSA